MNAVILLLAALVITLWVLARARDHLRRGSLDRLLYRVILVLGVLLVLFILIRLQGAIALLD